MSDQHHVSNSANRDSGALATVVIPVYNNEEGLALCLRALESQTVPQSQFEIVIVDNGSDIRPSLRLPDNARMLSQTAPGSYAARNKGIEEVIAPVVALTDSDCLPEPDWLAEGLAFLDDHPEVSLVGGHIEVFPRNAKCPTPIEVHETMDAFRQDSFLDHDSFGATANLFVRTEVFRAVGLFNPSLLSNGDVEFGNRSISAGYRMEYAESVVVRHPARRTFRAFFSMQLRTMAGTRDLAAVRGQPNPYRVSGVVRDLVPPVPSLIRALDSDAAGPPINRVKYAFATLVIHYARVVFRGRLLLGTRSPR